VPSSAITRADRYRGALLGLAVGDAVGTAVEFAAPGSFPPVTGMVGGGPFGLRPGQWTDDTSMALCLAESLIETRGFDPIDQLRRYCRWMRDGHLSSTGTCFDIGSTVRRALLRFEARGEPYPGSKDPGAAGNGSIMRLAPVVLMYANDPQRAVHLAEESSLTTHGATACVHACRYLAGLILGALQRRTKAELCQPRFRPLGVVATPYCAEIDEVAAGSYLHRDPPEITGTGYVVRSLEAALWAFHRSTTFREGCLLAVNLGDDADTTAAVFGQIAGAHYGVGGDAGIPVEWVATVAKLRVVEAMALRLGALSRRKR